MGFTKIILAKLFDATFSAFPSRTTLEPMVFPCLLFYWTGSDTQQKRNLKMMQNYPSHCAFLILFVCLIEILRLILQFFWREPDDFNIYNFPEDRDIDIIPDGRWTKAKTSITVDDHLHARVRDPKGECLEEGTQGRLTTKGQG